MKNLIAILITVILFTACQQQPVRFTTSSAEINAYKKGISAYESADWDTWQGMFADTAKVYYNTWAESSTAKETMQGHIAMIETLSSYEFDKDKMFIEQVIDDDGKTWVNFWGLWRGTMKANGKTLEIPVHLSTQFVDGKIVEEYGFWDMSSYVLELQALEAAAKEAQEAEESASAEEKMG